MLTIKNKVVGDFPDAFFCLGKGDVDKGTNRKTPGDSDGARPPKKEDYEKAKKENKKEKNPEKSQKDGVDNDEVDNEEKDKNQK
jgi:hypothetical protein